MDKKTTIITVIIFFLIICLLMYKFIYYYNCSHFQHNDKYKITNESYNYVKNYKKELIRNITKLLNDLNIKFFIADGILLEYHRGPPIYQDDDVDVRLDSNDFHKWIQFCKNNEKKLVKYNLIFDNRFKNIKAQKINGIQCSLINFNGNSKYKNMDIHLDLVSSNINSSVWKSFDGNFNNLRQVHIYDIKTFVPSYEDTINNLIKVYGNNYHKPKYSFNLK